ncbi:DUF2818 family protein [Undibacterium amnicola]|uniref:DUF2818 family protein n=1 Tax=Undibacterium amnicola TaxID=1834038 RepID=A0ABR6XN42_9BURK|nr:DUF2818 family protein [Undibacterium amnicola]MBC3830791.1 DUF2818 family protein [Undibacterium amnicola]
MNTSLSSWLVIIVALLAASLPFFTERVFGVLRLNSKKTVWLRLLELIVLYFVVGSLGFLLESNAGNRFDQRWEFFAITACLFIVFAFPGFVYRYLRKNSD